MGFVGNSRGPRKSVIVRRLGPGPFGLSEAEWRAELDVYLGAEFNGEIDSVYVDANDRYFVVFNSADGGYWAYYLDEHGFELEKPVKTEDLPPFLRHALGPLPLI